MKPEVWRQIKDIFHHASGLPAAEREMYLAEACGSDPELRKEVDSLLAASDHAEGFIESPAIEKGASVVLNADPIAGTTIGQYRVVEEIGRGGMGAVYRAEHVEGLSPRQVAIKIVKRGFDTDFIVRRFRQERRILATLDHPNIARLIDGGATADGVPYFIMEYVPGGETIDRYCDRRKLSTTERVRLFHQVCLAVAHAHRGRIVHRDIKPGNVLITPDGVPKLLDFGIAKLMDREDGTTFAPTLTAMGLMTPEYASPEQVRGEPVTPASDVYSLGVMLYELLTGHRPYRLKSRAPAEIAQVICSEEPVKPSTAVTRPAERQEGTTTRTLTPEEISLVRDGEPALLKQRLAGDLDAIVLKALRKDHESRYSTAAGLAADIERHLQHKPVDARRDALRYGFSIFVRKRRVWIAAAALLVIGAPITWYAVRPKEAAPTTTAAVPARRAVAVFGFRNLAKRDDKAWLSTALTEMFSTELAAGGQIRLIPGENVAQTKMDLFLTDADSFGPGTLTKIRAVVGADVVLLGSYLSNPDGSLRLDVRMQDAATGDTIAAIAEHGTETNLSGLVGGAGSRLREKLGLRGVTPGEEVYTKATLPSNPQAARWYSEGLERLRMFDTIAARDSLRKAADSDPKHALTHSALALALQSLGDDVQARQEAKLAFDLAEGLPRPDRLYVQGRYYESIASWDKALESYRALFGFFPDSVDYGLRLASAQTASGRGKEALETLDRLRQLPKPLSEDARIDLEESYAAESISDFTRMQKAAGRAAQTGIAKGSRVLVARARLVEGRAFEQLGNLTQAASVYEESKRIYETAGHQRGIAMAVSGLASVRLAQSDVALGIRLYEQSLEISRRIGYKSGIASALNNIAIAHKQRGEYDLAARLQTEALAIRREIGDRRNIAISLNNLANVRLEQGDLEDAKKLYTEALGLAREVGERRNIARSLHNLGLVLRFQANLTAARAMSQESMTLRQEIGDTNGYAMALHNYAQVLEDQGDLQAARKAYNESLEIKTQQKDKRGMGYALFGLGRVAMKSGDLAQARDYFNRSLTIRKQIGEKNAQAQSEQALAELSLEENKPVEAEPFIRAAIAEFEREKAAHLEASAEAVLAHVLAANGMAAEAMAQAARVEPVLARMQYVEMALSARAHLARAYSLAKRTDPKLMQAIDDATRLGLPGPALDLKLVKVETGPDRHSAASEIAREAESKGFGGIARRARVL